MSLPNTTMSQSEVRGMRFTEVTFYSTKIMQWDDSNLTLNSGGHRTPTTKSRMNKFISEFHLGGYKVIQKDFEWYVELDNYGRTMPFTDGMSLKI